MIKFFNLFFSFIICLPICFGLDKNPEIKRVCLDYNTSTVTISWETINDTCNSFNKNVIYSSENEGAWIKIIEIFNKNINEISFSVTNKSSIWKYKIVSYSACNNIDSFTSSPKYIEKDPPNNIEIDSVSFDPVSQNIIIGWKANSSKDVKGYKIFTNNNSVNVFVTYTYIPYANLASYTSSNPENFTIASFDSCYNYSLISSPQKTSYLSGKYDSCKKTYEISWTNYFGWSNTKSYLVINRNKTGFKELIDVTGLNTYYFKHLSVDKSFSFYIRTVNISTNYTSSSNTLSFYTKQDSIPTFMYLSNVTVEDNISLKISLEIDPGSSFDSLFVYKTSSTFNYKLFETSNKLVNQSHYEFIDLNVTPNAESYKYIIKCINTCKDTIMISNSGKSILLSQNYLNDEFYQLNWNPYSNWQNGLKEQQIQYRLNDNWNTKLISPASTLKFNLNDYLENYDSVCFRIYNVENKSSINTESVSISNFLCFKKQGNYFFPKTINPTSNVNNLFRVFGTNLEFEETQMEIYNRWGEKIYQSKDIVSGWDFTRNNKPIEMGTYIYKIFIKDKNLFTHSFYGTILVIY